MKKQFLKFLIFQNLLVPAIFVNAQNVGIGTNTPHPSAALDISSSNAGLLAPRIALTSINDISTIPNPATGLLIYNNATSGTSPNNVSPGYYFFNGTSWSKLSLTGSANGEMIYWNGQQWAVVVPGSYGQYLAFCDGVPKWGGCVPLVQTKPISNISAFTATSGGVITNDGGSQVTAKGLIWSTSPNPTIDLATKTNNGTDTGNYNSSLTTLNNTTTYYVRAYASNRAGIAYGNELTFTTLNYDITSGLVAYYPFSGNAGDSSGNGNHGTISGSIPFVNDRNEKAGSAAQFGAGRIVTNNNVFKFQYDQTFTIALWFNLTYGWSAMRFVSTECPEGNFRISTYDNGQFAVQFGGTYVYETVPIGTWNHLVYTYNNREAKLYLNGALKSTTNITTQEALNYCNPFTIGAKAGTTDGQIFGKMDEIRIFNRVLSADDVQGLFNYNQ